MLSFFEDNGDEGQLQFDDPEFSELYVIFRLRKSWQSGYDPDCKTMLYSLADEGAVTSERQPPSGWEDNMRELLGDRADEFELG